MLEHPYSASSWKESCVEEVIAMEEVQVVRGDMCAFAMWQYSDKSYLNAYIHVYIHTYMHACIHK